MARTVMVIGIPFAQTTDLKVIMKQHYLDNRCLANPESSLLLKGKDWYV